MSDAAFQNAMQEVAAAIEALLPDLLPRPEGHTEALDGAMLYACLGGGKRLRPLLTVAGADLFGVKRSHSLRAAAAIEMLHCYSLAHDDLPCMDDDDLRRGRPTLHRAYDEATAVLAGDGLQAQAFAVLADPATHPEASVRLELVAALAQAAGPRGMVGGQAIDLHAEALAGQGQRMTMAEISRLQALKTGALIGFAAEAGAILGQAPAPARQALRAYAGAIGLAFQIADDILDREGDAATLGKRVGKDEAAGKATFVGLLGLEGARARAAELVREAQGYLQQLPGDIGVSGDTEVLHGLAAFVITRRS
ncbi:polyprenyl synthetase family protein [Ferrovibrio sp.]|uniref:polyprenyl synthetase family protein n=1 Tax=Ferrovibrio sp. TaxID=1917215 RepID=UPI003D11E452